jgi:hypothetical protein
MPDGGYSTNSEAMQRARTRLSEAADEPAAEAKNVAPPKVTKERFGRVHGRHFDGYKAGFDEIAAAMAGLSAALSSFGGAIGSAGASYGNAEGDAAAGTTNAAK